MSGFWDWIFSGITGVIGGFLVLLLLLVGMAVGFVTMGVVWVDTFLINFWVLIDKALRSLPSVPAPLSWALICGTLGFFVHLGCTSGRG